MDKVMPNLYDEVLAYSHYRETKADVVEYYQEKYGFGSGKKGTSIPWKQHIISDLLGMQDITRGSAGDEEYKRLVKNTGKRFENRMYDENGNIKEEPRNAGQYKELGELLPPIPDGRFHITGIVWFKYMDEPCEPREVDEDLTLEQSQELAGMAYMDMVQSIINHYMTNTGEGGNIHEDEPMLVASNECAESDLHIELIE